MQTAECITASQVAKYIISHPRREQVFPGWHNDQIMLSVLEHMRDDCMLVVTMRGYIRGVLMYTDRPESGEVMIDAILSSEPEVFAMFIGMWLQRCPEKALVAKRHGRTVHYTRHNLERVTKQLRGEITHTPASVNYAIANN